MFGRSAENDEMIKKIQSALVWGNFDGDGNLDEDYLGDIVENNHLPYLTK